MGGTNMFRNAFAAVTAMAIALTLVFGSAEATATHPARNPDLLAVVEHRADRGFAKKRQLYLSQPAGQAGGSLYRHHDYVWF